MSQIDRMGSMDIDADATLQRREWRLQRIGWGMIALVLAAALAGLLGRGPASEAVAGDGSAPLRVEYHRFERTEAPARLRVRLSPDVVRAGTVRLRLNRAFVDQVELDRIEPEPESVTVAPDEYVYQIKTAPTAEETEVVIHFQPDSFGSLPVRVGVGDARPVAFSQWVYP